MTINERIGKVLLYSKLSSSEFADEIDVQRSSISHITSGRNKPSLEFITKIKSRFPEIEWEWLITGNGEMLVSEKKLETPTLEIAKPTPLPDLFSIFNTEVNAENPENVEQVKPSEKAPELKKNSEINYKPTSEHIINETLNNVNDREIKRIVLFFTDGKFESYET